MWGWCKGELRCSCLLLWLKGSVSESEKASSCWASQEASGGSFTFEPNLPGKSKWVTVLKMLEEQKSRGKDSRKQHGCPGTCEYQPWQESREGEVSKSVDCFLRQESHVAPQTPYAAKDKFELLILLPLLIKCWDWRDAAQCMLCWGWNPSACCAGDEIQDLSMLGKHTLCQGS